jgi:hypothetical protein
LIGFDDFSELGKSSPAHTSLPRSTLNTLHLSHASLNKEAPAGRRAGACWLQRACRDGSTTPQNLLAKSAGPGFWGLRVYAGTALFDMAGVTPSRAAHYDSTKPQRVA